MNIKKRIPLILSIVLLGSCSSGVVSWEPNPITDTSDIVITCDATKGDRGLYDYKGQVYIHIGVVTDLSETPATWQYTKFFSHSQIPGAIAEPAGENKWRYSIHNIRKFFEVPDDEKILQIVLFFRTGCKDTCRIMKNEDGSDIFIPVNDTSKP